jgi:hypothetical protein
MENNRLLLLEMVQDSWKDSELVVRPKDPKLRLCSYIAFSSFTDNAGLDAQHIWISYRQRNSLVSFNAKTREQRCLLNCAEKLKHGEFSVFCCRSVLMGMAFKLMHGRQAIFSVNNKPLFPDPGSQSQ